LYPPSSSCRLLAISSLRNSWECDGIWVTVQDQEGEIKPDKRQRKRYERSGKKVVLLVALGFWPDGRREILDWQLATSEEHTEWEVLLMRLCGTWSAS
jgi:hypothetical protein